LDFWPRDESVYEDTLVGMIPNIMFAFGCFAYQHNQIIQGFVFVLICEYFGIKWGLHLYADFGSFSYRFVFII